MWTLPNRATGAPVPKDGQNRVRLTSLIGRTSETQKSTVISADFVTITRFIVTVSATRYLHSVPNVPFRDLGICSLSAERFFVL